MDVFVEGENTCKSTWAVHASKICLTRLAVSITPGISEAGSDLKVGNKAYRRLPLISPGLL